MIGVGFIWFYFGMVFGCDEVCIVDELSCFVDVIIDVFDVDDDVFFLFGYDCSEIFDGFFVCCDCIFGF